MADETTNQQSPAPAAPEQEIPDVEALVAAHRAAQRAKTEEERARRKQERDAKNAKIREKHTELFVKVAELEAKGLTLLALPGWRDNDDVVAALTQIREAHKALVDSVEGAGLVLYDETIATTNAVAEGDQTAFANAVNVAVLRGNLVTSDGLTDAIRKKGSLVWVGRACFGWPGEPKALIAATMNARRRAWPKITPAEALTGTPGRCEFNAVQEFTGETVKARVVVEVSEGGGFSVVNAGELTSFLRNAEKGEARLRHLLKETAERTTPRSESAREDAPDPEIAPLDPDRSDRRLSEEKRIEKGLPAKRPQPRREGNRVRGEIAEGVGTAGGGGSRRKRDLPLKVALAGRDDAVVQGDSVSFGGDEGLGVISQAFAEAGYTADEKEVNATLSARKRAEELGVDLTTVTATGKTGVTVKDVEVAARAADSK